MTSPAVPQPHRLALWSGTLSPARLAMLEALAVGFLAGLATTGFRLTMGALGTWRNHVGLHPTAWYTWLYLPLIGLAGGAIAGHLVHYLAPEAMGSGIPYVKLVLARPGMAMRFRALVVKYLGGVVAIGAGLSLGREGPSVQIGAGVGGWVESLGRLPHAHRRRLIAAGAGAGVAAAFNAPIAGMLFVLEEMVQDFSSATLGAAVISAVTADVVARTLGGNALIYHLAPATFNGASELPLYALLGVACGLLGPLFSWAVLRALDLGDWLARFISRPWLPGVVGALTGLVGLRAPQILGGSYTLASHSLSGTLAGVSIPAIFAGKLAATALAYGSGAPGGIFSPSLVLGALVGLGVGQFAAWLAPAAGVSLTGCAFAGMGAYFAGVARAPLTAIMLVFEMTGNYAQIVPLMLAVIVASMVSERVGPGSLYHALLERDGNHLPPANPLGDLQDRAVSAAMQPNVETVDTTLALAGLVERFAASRYHGLPVIHGEGLLAGIVTRHDLRRALASGLPPETPVTAIGSFPCVTIPANAVLADAARLLADRDIGQLPVVAPADPRRLVGILTRTDLMAGAPDQPDHPGRY